MICTSSAKCQISHQAAQALAVTYILFLFFTEITKMTTDTISTTQAIATTNESSNACIDLNSSTFENINVTISAADPVSNIEAADSDTPADNVQTSNETLTDNVLQSTSLKACLTLDAMEAKRISWENNEYKASNIVLYNLLADCLLFCKPLEPNIAKYRNMKLEDFFIQRQYSWKKDAKLSAKVTRAVFGNIDRKRLSTYAIVIDAALQAYVDPFNLTAWITKEGGIQAIKLAKSTTFISPQEKVETTEQKLEAKKDNGLANVKSQALSLLADSDKVGENCVLIATQEADGSFTILSLTHKSSALNAAYLAVYSDEKAEEAKHTIKPFKIKVPTVRKKKVEPITLKFATDVFDMDDKKTHFTPKSTTTTMTDAAVDTTAVNDETTLMEELKAA
jgi:hypothetical protein